MDTHKPCDRAMKGGTLRCVRVCLHVCVCVYVSQVYSTHQHQLVRTFTRPPKGAAAAYSHASLQWGLNGWLYACWPDCIKVTN